MNFIHNISRARALSTIAVKPVINVSEPAWQKLLSIYKKSGNPHFLFSADGGGCGGFKYNLQQTEDINSKDPKVTNGEITIAIDQVSEFLVLGTTIDYKRTEFEHKFEFIPDKTFATSCGCGVSFSPKN